MISLRDQYIASNRKKLIISRNNASLYVDLAVKQNLMTGWKGVFIHYPVEKLDIAASLIPLEAMGYGI